MCAAMFASGVVDDVVPTVSEPLLQVINAEFRFLGHIVTCVQSFILSLWTYLTLRVYRYFK